MARTTARKDVAQDVTDLIIGQLEAGTIPWQRPWTATGGSFPRSMATGKTYRGVNLLLLGIYADLAGYSSPWWGTYKQISAQGGQVRKGEKAVTVVLYSTFDKDEVNSSGETVTKSVPFLRSFAVFNACQADSLPAKFTEAPALPGTELERLDHAETIAAAYIAEGPSFSHGGDRAYYTPATDSVRIPALESFTSAEGYYSTLFHELTHSTGHTSRLDREGVRGEGHAFGSTTYAAEELVAEMGAAMLCAIVGIEQTETIPASAAYIANWLTALRNDKKLILTASKLAQRAVDLIAPPEALTAKSTEELAA